MQAALLAALAPGHAGPPVMSDALLQTLRSVLRDPQLDPAFKEVALLPPSEGQLAEALSPYEPQQVHAVREQWRAMLAEALHDDWQWAFEAHQVREGYSPDSTQAGKRALTGLALQMLCQHAVRHGDTVWPGRAYQQFKDASNMSDRLAALQALTDSHSPLAEQALQRLHALAQGDALMLDKWFMLQARTPEPVGQDGLATGSAFMRAKSLLKHPDFSLRNPNRMRSLLGTLCASNPAAFHRRDAAGYVMWADAVLEIDSINPQVAGRLARVMDRWATLAEPYRTAAREAIARVASRPDLSNDVREIVAKALEAT
jgi:aminopeptidase N